MKWHIFNKVKHNPEAAAVAFLALSAQVFHAQHVFFQSGHSHGPVGVFNSWLYALAVEFAVFFFVLRGWGWVSWGFAAASIGVNVAYYTLAHQADRGWAFMFQADMIPQTWFMWLIAVVLPVAVAAFSHAADGEGEPSPATQKGRSRVKDLFVMAKDRIMGNRTEGPGRAEQGVGVQSSTKAAERPTVAQDPAQDVILGPVLIEEGELDDVDVKILSFLAVNGPSPKSQIAAAVDMTSQAMERKKKGKRVGRLVNLEEAGLVSQDGEGDWEVVRDDLEDLDPVGESTYFTNGNVLQAVNR